MNEASIKAREEPASFHEVADALGLGMSFRIEVAPGGLSRRFTCVGPNCFEMTGITPKAALANPNLLYDQIVPEHRGLMAEAEAAARKADGPFSIEVEMVLPNGARRWRRIQSAPTRKADGSVVWTGLLTDITQERKDAAERREQQLRLEAAVEVTGLGFWEWDVHTDRLTWSARNREMFGLGPDEPITIERFLSLVHPDDAEEVRRAYGAAEDQPEGGDYAVEHRVAGLPNGALRWIHAQGRVVKDAAGVRRVVGTSLDITKRKQAEDRRSLLLGELAHRAKNGIAVMMSLVAQTARRAQTVEEFEDVLQARLQAMAASQDLVTASGGRPVLLADVVATSLNPFDASRFLRDDTLTGVMIAGDMAVSLGLLLHELATNSAKYGALSAPGGRVRLDGEVRGEASLVLTWTETDGPPVEPPGRRGFGSRLIEVSLRPQGGAVEARFDPTGFQATMRIPTTRGATPAA